MRPNIVLILIDAARVDRFGCYGYDRDTTPNIDGFSQGSTLYQSAYSPAAWTLPAVSSVFTGLYPTEHRVDFDNAYLDPQFRTLAQLLAEAGYQTMGISANAWVGSAAGLKRGFKRFKLVDRIFNQMPPQRWQVVIEKIVRFFRGSSDSGGRRATRLAINWLRDRDKDEPFFLFLHYMEPHAPYRPTWQWANRFFERRSAYKEALKLAKIELEYLAGDCTLGSDELDSIGRLYDAELRYADHQVGKILRELLAQDDFSNTLVIITADHGENLGEHGLLGHQYCLRDTLLHVPLLIRFPGEGLPAFNSDLVLNQDIFATCLSLVGYGQNQLSYATRWVDLHPENLKASVVPEYVFAQYLYPMTDRFQKYFPHSDYTRYDHKLWSVRSDRFKLIRRDDGELSLFDIESDPSEKRNLVTERPDLVSELEAELKGDPSTEIERSEISALEFDEVTVQRLRDLGYME